MDQGYFFMKIKIGQPGTQEEMLNKDKARLSAIHKAIGHVRTSYTANGKLPYYFDANGQYEKKETLLNYNYMPSKQEWIDNHWGAAYADMPATPLWEFGYGLSYTTFEYKNLKVSPAVSKAGGEVTVSCDVMNSGNRKGSEVAQLYIRDEISSVTRPVRELKGFEKVTLEPGEKKMVTFTLNREHLAFYNRSMEFVTKPGIFQVMVGSSSDDIRLKGQFEIAE